MFKAENEWGNKSMICNASKILKVHRARLISYIWVKEYTLMISKVQNKGVMMAQ